MDTEGAEGEDDMLETWNRVCGLMVGKKAPDTGRRRGCWGSRD